MEPKDGDGARRKYLQEIECGRGPEGRGLSHCH